FNGRASGIVDSFNRHLGLLRAAQVSASLVRILDSLGATRLRPSGAVYWLPEYHLDRWQRVAEVVEKAGLSKPNSVYVIRHQMDADAMRAVRDAIVAEVGTEAARIKREVQSGELGERALEHRQQHAAELQQKIAMYEDLLGIGLELLHATVDEADQAAGL